MRRTLYHNRRRARLGVRGGLALAVIVITLLGVGLLSRKAGGNDAGRLADAVKRESVAPADLVRSLARSHRLLVLGDVHNSAAAKRLAADVIAAVATAPGLDAVVLEVPSDAQPTIDHYLNTTPEDASLLLADPRTLNARWGTQQAYLQLYHRIWQLNDRRGPARRIRIVAADLPGWPPSDATSPRDAASAYARRDQHMAQQVESMILGPSPRSRVLLFVGGYHALKGVHGELRVGGGDRITVRWLADRLEQRHRGDVASVLMDAGVRPGGALESVTAYTGTLAYPLLTARLGRADAFGTPVGAAFDFLRQPIRTRATAGLSLDLEPAAYTLGAATDGYIYLPGG